MGLLLYFFSGHKEHASPGHTWKNASEFKYWKDCSWTSVVDVSLSATILDVLRNPASGMVLEPEMVTFGQDDWSCPCQQKEQSQLRATSRCGWSLWDCSKPGCSFLFPQWYWNREWRWTALSSQKTCHLPLFLHFECYTEKDMSSLGTDQHFSQGWGKCKAEERLIWTPPAKLQKVSKERRQRDRVGSFLWTFLSPTPHP